MILLARCVVWACYVFSGWWFLLCGIGAIAAEEVNAACERWLDEERRTRPGRTGYDVIHL